MNAAELADWLVARRWFGSKGRELTGVEVIDMAVLDAEPPALSVALVAARFASGADALYQLPIAAHPDGGLDPAARIAGADNGEGLYDLFADPGATARLLRLIEAGGEVASHHGRIDFGWSAGKEPVPAGAEARPITAEQSNSSMIFGENAILKIYRRLEPGINPELEVLRFLDRQGFAQIPALLGWLEYSGEELEATLGVVQEFVADGRDGWDWALDRLGDDAESLLDPLRDLGRAVGAMHTALAGDPTDPDFAPEPRDAGAAGALVASLDEQIDRLFLALPDDARLAPIAGRQEELRDQLRALAGDGGGMAIRVHGDLHLGQTLRAGRGWVILDFEGEPARSLPERRAKHSPLRDVAGLLRSIAYAPLAARLQRGAEPPEAWEERARVEVLDGYLEGVDPALLPPTRGEVDQLLAIYELEKAVYELGYELNHRPDWVEIPVAGISRLLEVSAA